MAVSVLVTVVFGFRWSLGHYGALSGSFSGHVGGVSGHLGDIIDHMTRRKSAPPSKTEVYAARLESLLAAVWPGAMAGDPKVVEVARRILAQQGRHLGLAVDVGPTPPISDSELAPDDELASFRRRYQRKQQA
jgi:hypothetical protein